MKSFFQNNRAKIATELKSGDMAILLAGNSPKSTADARYSFLPNKNFYYFTGCTQENFILTMHKKEDALESVLYIERPDYDIEKWIGRKLTIEQAKEISGVENVQYLDAFHKTLNRQIYDGKVNSIYLDLERLDWDERNTQIDEFASEVSRKYPFIVLKTLHGIASKMRVLKEDFEIGQIEKAVEMTKDGLDAILVNLKPGMFEYQLESIFSHSIRMNGADGNSFPTIAASGEDAVILHYVENKKELKAGDLVLLDLGAQYMQYAADITRTYPVNGKFSERQKTLYNAVLKAQEAVIEAIKPGVPFASLNKICQESLTQSLTEIGLIKDQSELGKYYYHGVSHHLGLDVHDLGERDCTLQPGMVVTVEPGLYVAEEGIGIRIEEDVLVTPEGNRVLSEAIPKTVDEIESIMSR